MIGWLARILKRADACSKNSDSRELASATDQEKVDSTPDSSEERELFPAEILEGRFADLWEHADRFGTAFGGEYNVNVTINVARLYMTIVSTYDDIERYKKYHLNDPHSERSDAVKRAAYLTKWIARFKPLNADRGDIAFGDIATASQDGSDLVNEFFAVSIAIANLNLHTDRDFFLSDKKNHELVYDLIYRTLSEDALLLFYQTIVDILLEDVDVVVIQ
jgi:hypothetical protein